MSAIMGRRTDSKRGGNGGGDVVMKANKSKAAREAMRRERRGRDADAEAYLHWI
jgi:hypothetical protein